MREFIYYSKNAVTKGNFDTRELMKAGRMDIVCQMVIMSFFVSHNLREDVKLHLIFDGPPDAPKHIEMFPGKELESEEERVDISKKDVAGLIKRLLYKYRPMKKIEAFPGYWIEKKGLVQVIEELKEKGKEIFLLDKRGEDIRDAKMKGNSVFVLGDQDGIPKQEMKKLKKLGVNKISIGPCMYFASQTMTILQNEIDRREAGKSEEIEEGVKNENNEN